VHAPGEPGLGQERTNEEFRDVADRIVKAINAADYEGIRKDFNKDMLAAFLVERCRTFFSKEIKDESLRTGRRRRTNENDSGRTAGE